MLRGASAKLIRRLFLGSIVAAIPPGVSMTLITDLLAWVTPAVPHLPSALMLQVLLVI